MNEEYPDEYTKLENPRLGVPWVEFDEGRWGDLID